MTTPSNEPPAEPDLPLFDGGNDGPFLPRAVGEAEQHETDRKILRGSMWVAVGYGGRQVLTLISMLALVRILEPEAFGLMALAMTMLLVLEAVHESGLASALVYLRSDIERAAGTALVVSTISAVALYAWLLSRRAPAGRPLPCADAHRRSPGALSRRDRSRIRHRAGGDSRA